MMIRSLLVFGFLAVASTGSARANFLTNGSFETPVTATFTAVNAGSPALTGWTVGGTSVDVVNQSVFPSRPALDGLQYLDLSGTPGPGSVSQSFTATVGTSYTLSFGWWNNPGPPGSGSHTFEVMFDGAALLITGTGTESNWTTASYVFNAASTSSTISFRQLGTTLDPNQGTLLDNVSVVATGVQAVPVPATAFAFVAGFGLLRRGSPPLRPGLRE